MPNFDGAFGHPRSLRISEEFPMSDSTTFTDLFNHAEAILVSLLPKLPPDADPPPLMLALLDAALPPALLRLPPILLDAKLDFVFGLSALVQALKPLAIATILPAWDRSAQPNREIIAVTCHTLTAGSLATFDVKRRLGRPPVLTNPQPPKRTDSLSGLFSGPYTTDISGLTPEVMEFMSGVADRIRTDHLTINATRH